MLENSQVFLGPGIGMSSSIAGRFSLSSLNTDSLKSLISESFMWLRFTVFSEFIEYSLLVDFVSVWGTQGHYDQWPAKEDCTEIANPRPYDHRPCRPYKPKSGLAWTLYAYIHINFYTL